MNGMPDWCRGMICETVGIRSDLTGLCTKSGFFRSGEHSFRPDPQDCFLDMINRIDRIEEEEVLTQSRKAAKGGGWK